MTKYIRSQHIITYHNEIQGPKENIIYTCSTRSIAQTCARKTSPYMWKQRCTGKQNIVGTTLKQPAVVTKLSKTKWTYFYQDSRQLKFSYHKLHITRVTCTYLMASYKRIIYWDKSSDARTLLLQLRAFFLSCSSKATPNLLFAKIQVRKESDIKRFIYWYW